MEGPERNSSLFAAGRFLEIIGLMIPLAGITFGLTAPEASPGLTVEFVSVGVGLAVFYAGRSMVSRAIHGGPR